MEYRGYCCLLLAVLLGGCGAIEPRLHPWDPPPLRDDGALLHQVTANELSAVSQLSVAHHRESWLSLHRDDTDPVVAAVLEHRIHVGMTLEQVVLAMEAHPMRVRNDGPPGGPVYLWEPIRFWVRFDENALVVAAGRF